MCACGLQGTVSKSQMVVVGLKCNLDGFPLGNQDDLFTSIKQPEVYLKPELVLRLSSFECEWLHQASWATELRRSVSSSQLTFLTLSGLFPNSVLGGTAQRTLALNFKVLGLLSRWKCLLGSEAFSISGNGTVNSMTFVFFQKNLSWLAFVFPLPSHTYINNPCYWVISVCKAF